MCWPGTLSPQQHRSQDMSSHGQVTAPSTKQPGRCFKQHNSASSVHVVVSLSFFAGVSYSDPTDAELLAAADEVDPPSEYTF